MAGPFKMKSGNSPLTETKDWFNVKGYLKGEQGLIPDFKGESTAKTATNISKSIQEGQSKVKQIVRNVLTPKKNETKTPENKMMMVQKKLKRNKEKVIKIKPIEVQKLKVNTQSGPRPQPRQS